LPAPTHIGAVNKNYIVVTNFEVSYVIYLHDCSSWRFNGCKYHAYDRYILVEPTYYYDVCTSCSLVDVIKKEVYTMQPICERHGLTSWDISGKIDIEKMTIYLHDNETKKEVIIPLEEVIDDDLPF
jgi:hypothetical protein